VIGEKSKGWAIRPCEKLFLYTSTPSLLNEDPGKQDAYKDHWLAAKFGIPQPIMSDENKERITQFFVACSRAITTAYRIDIDRVSQVFFFAIISDQAQAMALLQVLKERHVSFADNPRWSFTVETLESMDSLIPKRGEPTSRVSTQSSVPEDEQPDLNGAFLRFGMV
jgi:hypothetical protein